MVEDPGDEVAIGILFDVLVAHERVGALLRVILQPLGLTPSEYAVTSLLITAGPRTHGAIGRRLGITRSTLSGLLASLERKDLIERRPVEDGRSALITMTATGRRLHRRAERAVARHWTERQDPKSIKETQRRLTWLIGRLEEAADQAC
ncbi:MarR family winged helix-turn-helix transcriptional regulator [Microlunatus sp. GCM10028923]|uniref:MarR family winged helix-turn-helix transcriptional regulator n=1 Tax=Microlunatus sp. GCM10028923 TaxID=3273400 RepID=UPI00360B8C6F